MRRTFIVLGAIAVAALTLGAGMPGAPPPSPAPGQLRMTVGTLGAIGSLDPRHGNTVIAREVWNLQYPTLTALDPVTLAPTTGLAAAWTPLPRGNGWRYTLRPKLTWTDGQPVTAADVVYSLDHARDEKWPYARATIPGLSGLHARAVNAQTVAVTGRGARSLPGLLLHVVPAHVYSKAADISTKTGALGVGDGPWHVVATDADSVTLGVPGPGGPPLSQIAFRTYPNAAALIAALAHGHVDVISGAPASDVNKLENTPKVTVNHVPDGTEYVLRFGTLPDPLLRNAISLAIDRDALVAAAVYGVGTPLAARAEPLPARDAPVGSLFPHPITLAIPADTTGRRVGAFVRTSLASAGIKTDAVAAGAPAEISLERVTTGNQPPSAIGLFEPDTLQAFRSDHVTGFLPEPSQRSLLVFGPTVAPYSSIVAAAQPPGEELSNATYAVGAAIIVALCGVAYWLASVLRKRFVPQQVPAVTRRGIMQIDAALTTTDLTVVPTAAAGIESAGYDGIFTFEGQHDPFFPLLLAAEHTERVQLTTAVAIAFARNPMTLAQTAYDLQLASHGRFRLGLGTQIKPHIEKRFSMPWSQPVERMHELVLAIRAIWDTWHTGTKLDFRGEFYNHTLMTPFFNPGPSPYGLPGIYLAGVGPRMTEMAGEVADGFIVHPFATERSLRELTIPAIERGATRAGRARSDLDVAFPLMAVVATSDEQLERGRAAMRPRLAFYGSTPAYKVILDVHGWGDLQPELNRLSKTGDWATMSALITDEMVDAFSVQGTPNEVGAKVRARYGDLVQRISFDTSNQLDADTVSAVLADLRA